LALEYARPKAAYVGGDRDGKQDGAGGLGYARTGDVTLFHQHPDKAFVC
jgi:hypothetical protein